MNTPNTVYTAPFFAFDWRDYSYFAQLNEAPVEALCARHETTTPRPD